MILNRDGVALVLNKYQINTCQFINKFEIILPAVQNSLFCDIEQGWRLEWWPTGSTSMLGSLEINWNKFPSSKILLVCDIVYR